MERAQVQAGAMALVMVQAQAATAVLEAVLMAAQDQMVVPIPELVVV